MSLPGRGCPRVGHPTGPLSRNPSRSYSGTPARVEVKVQGAGVVSGVTALQRAELACRFGLATLDVDSRMEGCLIGDLETLQSQAPTRALGRR